MKHVFEQANTAAIVRKHNVSTTLVEKARNTTTIELQDLPGMRNSFACLSYRFASSYTETATPYSGALYVTDCNIYMQ